VGDKCAELGIASHAPPLSFMLMWGGARKGRRLPRAVSCNIVGGDTVEYAPVCDLRITP
jgi:hypothetical protein